MFQGGGQDGPRSGQGCPHKVTIPVPVPVAATALQAAGIQLVIAGSYSQTYLRNAINNGFICVECPALVDAMKAHFSAQADQRTIIGESNLKMDFANSVITWNGDDYRFTPLGTPVQEVVIAGGVENQVRASL